MIGRWLTKGDACDLAGECHGKAYNIQSCEGPDGAPNSAVLFNGRDSRVEIPDTPPLRLGTDDFSVSVWVRPEKPIQGAMGDILSKFDPERRCGINLQLSGSSPAYSGMSDARHVHFGIDDGYISEWEDCGKPWPSNSLVSTLIAYNGELYAGISDADRPEDAAHVFRWGRGRRWIDCGRLGNDPGHLSVMSMLVHDGRLYAGTGIWDWTRVDGGENFKPALSRVFRYEGEQNWKDLGQVGTSVRVLCMASFNGYLYVGLDRAGGGHVFYLENDHWKDCGALNGDNVENLFALGGILYANTHQKIYCFEDVNRWIEIGANPFDITQIHSTQVYGGRMHLGTWPQGYVLRYEGDGKWSKTGHLGIPEGMKLINEINDLTVYNGKLYAGVIPKAQVYRYESDGHWTLLARLASRQEWSENHIDSWGRVTCLTVFQGRLFAATGACKARAMDVDAEGTHGRVMAMQAGQAVSYDRDIGGNWTHLTAVRRKNTLKLYINGSQVAASKTFAGRIFDLSSPAPLQIGVGPQNYFSGALADLRLYKGALTSHDISRICACSQNKQNPA